MRKGHDRVDYRFADCVTEKLYFGKENENGKMKKPDLNKICNNVKSATVKHSPEILTGVGIAGMVTTTVMAVRATPKAIRLLDDEKKRQSVDKLEPAEAIKTAWKCYIPAAVTGTVSVVCLMGASSVNARRNAALTAAYTLSESTLRDYRKKVIETIGEKKEQTVRDAVAKDHLEKKPVENKEVIITSKGDTLCFDVVSGRYFKSDVDRINKAVNELNRRMRYEMYVSLNDFYYEIGLESIKLGNELGWNIDDDYIELQYSSQLATDGTPCLVIDYRYGPRYDFRNLM